MKILVLRKYHPILNNLIMNRISKNVFKTKHDKIMVFVQNKWQNSGGNPIYRLTRWSNIQILTKNYPKYWFYENNSPT